MAVALVQSVLAAGGFDPLDLSRQWIEWMGSKPPDIGATTSYALRAIKHGAAWDEAGRDLYRERPQSLANGSLMRNGVVPGLTRNIEDAWDLSFRHGIITHYAPLSVLCCAAQTLLIDGLLRGGSPFGSGWAERFTDDWRAWIEAADTPWTQAWLAETWPHIDEAIELVRDSDVDPDRFDPFALDLTEGAGYCLTTLQIAVWATRWALRGSQVPLPQSVPARVRGLAPESVPVVQAGPFQPCLDVGLPQVRREVVGVPPCAPGRREDPTSTESHCGYATVSDDGDSRW